MRASRSRMAIRGILGLTMGAALATASIGTAVGAKPVPAITQVSCAAPLYEGQPFIYTSVSWEGLRPSRVVFWWSDPYTSAGTTIDHPKGSQLSVPTPSDWYTPEWVSGAVTVYGPHGIELQSSFTCVQAYY